MNRNLTKALGKFILGILFIPLINGCSSAINIQSTSNDKQIVVDGNQQDWGSLSFIKNENIGFGFRNDKDNLYLCVVTSDRTKIRKILSGLTVWLKTDKDEIGIKFPMKPDFNEMGEMRNSQSEPGGISNRDADNVERTNQSDRDARREERMKLLVSRSRDLQIINTDDLPLYTKRSDEGSDFIGKLGYQNEQLVYELKVPLMNNDISKRIFDNNINDVNISFMTDKLEMPNRNSRGGREGGMEPPVGDGGFGRGRGDGGFGGPPPGGGRGERTGMPRMDFDALEYNFDVTLSK